MSMARLKDLMTIFVDLFPMGGSVVAAQAGAVGKEEALGAAGLPIDPSIVVGRTFAFAYHRNMGNDGPDATIDDICIGYGSVDGITVGVWPGDSRPMVSLLVSGLELILESLLPGNPKLGVKISHLHYLGGEQWIATCWEK